MRPPGESAMKAQDTVRSTAAGFVIRRPTEVEVLVVLGYPLAILFIIQSEVMQCRN
jgi:hypothetical protein